MKKWLLILLLGMGMPVFAGLEVAGIFAPHMVVQRNRPLPVWGRAAPGQMVTVTLGGNTGSVKADAEGAWRLVLPPHKAGGPVEMTITAGEEEKRIGNILFGDVFLCSGQSNMEWHLMNTDGGAEAIATSADSQLRLFFSDRRMSESPEPEVRGKWYVASPKTTPKFSGVAYYFGRAMRRELGVPIGLINASRGASRVESWIPREFLATTAPEWLEEYRRSLLKYKYEQKYVNERLDTAVTADEISGYYEEHKNLFVLKSPIAKVRYMRISSGSPNVSLIKKKMASTVVDDLIEADSLAYFSADIFTDYSGGWISIAQLAGNFGTDYTTLMSKVKNSMVEMEDSSGKLNVAYIVDYMAAGDQAPLDYCSDHIRDMIISIRKHDLINNLERDLLEDARSKGRFEIL